MNGKEDHVEPGKIFDTSSVFLDPDLTRHELSRFLRAIDRERDRLKTAIDPHELWEVVAPEGDRWTLEELASLYFADDAGPHGKAALFRALEDGRAFHRRGKAYVPLRPDRIAAQKAREQRANRSEAWLHEAADWLRRSANGEEAAPPPNAERAVELLAGKVLHGAEHPEAKQAAALAKLAHFHSNEAVFDALVEVGHWRRDENLDLLRRDVPVEFSAEAVAEAEAAQPREPHAIRPAVPQEQLRVIAEDEDGQERAFGVKQGLFGATVTVHFACPSLLFEPGGAVQQDAGDRAAALRLPDRLIPMLPDAVTAAAALAPEANRATLALRLRFDSRLELKDHRFELRRVRAATAISPAEANARADTDATLGALLKLARHLRERRVAGGAVVIPDPDVRVRVRHGAVELTRAEADAPARLIKEELSILANTLAGRFLTEREAPAIYRTESGCREVLVDPGRYDPVACYCQKRIMPRAGLQTIPAPHRGLGVETYVPIDRPCSRYTDLLMQQQIIGLLESGRLLHSEEDLKWTLLYTASARTGVRDIEKAARRYWLLRHLQDKTGQEVDAVVLERFGAGYLVELAETLLRTFCPATLGVELTPGAGVRVRLAKVSARADEIWTVLVSTER